MDFITERKNLIYQINNIEKIIGVDFEEQFGKPIGQSFDLIAGTSIGGILALAAAYEVPMNTVVNLFQDHGKKIFERNVGNRIG